MKTIGVLGGMGPAATVDFLARLVDGVGAGRDQEHPPCIAYNACHIPDGAAHLTGRGDDPSDALVQAARTLEAAGAAFIAIPCNSAHAYLATIRAAVGIPVLNMIGLAVTTLAQRYENADRIGLLAATGTVESGLYEVPLREAGLEPLYPEPGMQAQVMAAIRAVKGGQRSADQRLQGAAGHLVARGAQALLLACTEVPLAFDATQASVPVVDATTSLVDASLHAAGFDPDTFDRDTFDPDTFDPDKGTCDA